MGFVDGALGMTLIGGAHVVWNVDVLKPVGRPDMKMKIVDLGLGLSTQRQQEIAGSAVYKASVR